MYIFPRSNRAIFINNDAVNGAHADIKITTHGSDVYWAWCAFMGLFTLLFFAWGFMRAEGRRLFHNLAAFTALIAAICYFTMASNLGWTGIVVEWHRTNHHVAGDTRQIFYARYIEWFLTMPLILSNLYFAAGMSWQSLAQITLVAWIFVVTRLVGALISTTYKWGYFVFSLVSFFYIVYQLFFAVRTHATALGDDIRKAYFFPAALQSFIWLLYPIAWGVCEGGNLIAPDSEAVFYGILDIISIVCIPCLLLLGLKNIDVARLGLEPVADPHAEKAAHNGNGANAA
ncbi:family A G protein-coupled receptor-like protein [Lepidopterella palustris CBS 459.81]|uniref:Family A G protein-coupled receptor-like protein n=1 Tax=Lepidopterella palustris CBS 459.81 TaxID=1314670 RepID=A0A8E2EBX6_9PEZI|nr:family A G protein-coupled receptor-like protein [Lepidopterella palustris CBS 459.81]